MVKNPNSISVFFIVCLNILQQLSHFLASSSCERHLVHLHQVLPFVLYKQLYVWYDWFWLWAKMVCVTLGLIFKSRWVLHFLSYPSTKTLEMTHWDEGLLRWREPRYLCYWIEKAALVNHWNCRVLCVVEIQTFFWDNALRFGDLFVTAA